MIAGFKSYGAATATLLLLDYVWLGLLMRDFYFRHLGSLARSSSGSLTPIWWAAIVVYLTIPAAIVLFVLPRASSGSPVLTSLGWGFLFGAFVYGVYDFTNYSTLKDWSLTLAVTDTLWGGIVCSFTASVASKFR